MTNRTPALLIAVAAAASLAATGCGSDDETKIQNAANSDLTPQQVVDQYRAAVIDGDGEAACALVSDAGRKIAEEGASDCAFRFSAVDDQDTPEDKAAEKAMHPQAVVTGTKAVAKFKTLGGDPTQITLEKGAGGWKVTGSPELENFRISNRYG